MEIESYLKDWRAVAIIMVLAIIFLTLPHLNRISSGNTSLIGDKPYFNMRIAELSQEEGPVIQDDMVYSERTYIANPYQVMLGFLGKYIPFELLSKILPLFFGLISLLMFSLIIDRLNTEPLFKTLLLLVIVLSPIFVFTFTLSNKFSMIITLFAIGSYFFLGKRKYELILSLLFFLPITLFGTFESIAIIAVALVYVLIKKEKKEWFIILLSFIGLSTLLFNIFSHNVLIQSENILFVTKNILKGTISDFGSKVGVGVFKIMLAIIGLMIIWTKKKENSWLLLLLGLSVISLFFNNLNIIYTSFILSYFAAVGFKSLIKREWKVETLKYLTIITLILGMLFSTVSYMSLISSSDPSSEQIEGLMWLKENSMNEGFVLSHYSNGFWIETIAERRVIMDSYFEHTKGINEIYDNTKRMFHSRNLDNSLKLMKDLDIRYIWIDKEMRDGLIWEREGEGLLFLLNNKEKFRKAYSSKNIDIYEVIPE